ncbi:MAG: M20 family metallopeptidase [Chloroflexi bacterium]|nr:M20 family metallopeptidase [Chloroflexota bacterium]
MSAHKDAERLKAQAATVVDGRSEELRRISLDIHGHPEVAFQEHRAAKLLAGYLEANGFRVERGICDMPTAFKASYGSGRPAIAILAEYDALPKLGHACGHNIIGTAAVGAGVALKGAVDALGGSVAVFGTPAEEVWGGKVPMVEKGAFAEVDCALEVHPSSRNSVVNAALACVALDVEFFGKAAHAAAHPDWGINALEALLQSYSHINALRQHIRPTARIHGIITDGGEAANIVPAHAAGTFLVRAVDDDYLDELIERTLACFKAGALATGARLEYRFSSARYGAMHANRTLAEAFRQNLGRFRDPQGIEAPEKPQAMGSTDMGNVSAVVPAIHPMLAVAPPDVSLHTPEFVQWAAAPEGHQALLDGAKAMALTAIDVLADLQLLAAARAEFERGKASGWKEG